MIGARIAERMGVSPPAVTQAMKRLAQHGLAVLDPDDGLRLSLRGRKQAERTIRRHYLLERLLVDELGFDWVDVDEEADRLEHSLSSRLEAHLFERLGRPTTCPHGNPFPGSRDERRLLDARRLTEVEAGEETRILRITEEAEENSDLMHLLYESRLLPGVGDQADQRERRGADPGARGRTGLGGDLPGPGALRPRRRTIVVTWRIR